MKAFITVVAVAFALLFAQMVGAQQVQTLRGTDAAAADKAPAERPYLGKMPGEQKRVARTFSTQPPVIPHSIEDFGDITLQDNPCLGCHGAETFKAAGAPKPSESHFADRDGKRLADVAGSRYQCTACHAPQANARPLVQNTFRGDVKAKR